MSSTATMENLFEATAGILDTVFNGTGKLTTNLGGVDQAYALTIGPDYKITVVGASGSDFGIARYKVSSSLEERLYVLTDNNHDVTAITDVFGNVKERFIYDPYGTPTVLNSSWNSTSDSYAWAILFQGKRFDTTTQTYDFDHRIYKPSLGTFIQADPLGYPDGVNRYQVECDNPFALTDALGLSTTAPQGTTRPSASQPLSTAEQDIQNAMLHDLQRLNSMYDILNNDDWATRAQGSNDLLHWTDQDLRALQALAKERDNDEVLQRVWIARNSEIVHLQEQIRQNQYLLESLRLQFHSMRDTDPQALSAYREIVGISNTIGEQQWHLSVLYNQVRPPRPKPKPRQ